MKRGLNRFIIRLLLLCLPVAICFEVMYRVGIFPVLTISQLFDYKVLEAKRHSSGTVDLMVAGSSVALYDLDSRLIADSLRMRYHNFGSWGMQITDIGAALRALVQDYRPREVVICSCVRDFVDTAAPSYAGYAGSPAFFREHFPEYFYVRNFNAVHSLLDRRFRSRRPTLDAWGGASVEEMWQGRARNDEGEQLAFPTASSGLQYRALDSLCAFLRDQKVRLIFAQVPMEARYTGTRAEREALAAHFERCRSIVLADGGDYLNYYDTTAFPDDLFADLTHLSNAGKVVLTRKLVADLKGTIK